MSRNIAHGLKQLITACSGVALLFGGGCQSQPVESSAATTAPVHMAATSRVVAPATVPVSTPVQSPATQQAQTATLAVDTALPTYRAAQLVSGTLRSVGSDSMDRIMQLWEAEFTKSHPEVVLRHEGKGSGTALPSLMKGLSDLGPMSRSVTTEEIASFSQRFDRPPAQVRVALDALAVFVHPSNPIAKQGLTFAQLDAIFSSTRKRGGTADIVTWGQLGLTGAWASAPITVCTRNKASGTYAFFREHVLEKGDYKSGNHELAGSRDVIKAVVDDPFAIGYSSVGYVTPEVAAIPLSARTGQPFIAPTAATVYANRYPLARYFYLTVNFGSDEPMKPQTQEFLRFVLSRNGQLLVLQEGLFPVTASIAREESNKLGLNP